MKIKRDAIGKERFFKKIRNFVEIGVQSSSNEKLKLL